MNLFHIIEGAQVIIFSRGFYSQRKVYRRGAYLFANQRHGFVKLFANGGTSIPKTIWLELEGPGITLEGNMKKPVWHP